VAWRNKTFQLAEGDNIIGRDPRSAVWIEAAGVSRRHAKIHVDGVNRRATAHDLGSTNGTFVGRVPVQGELLLADGDTLRVGTVELTIHLWATDKAPETKRIRRRTR
jgi:pSer/pThr/pTyr-binding forkhead associated (FHA) protein